MRHKTQSKRLLIVDDHTDFVYMLADNIKELSKDYYIDTANNGDEALAKIQDVEYALVLTDYMMPGMNGLDLAKSVRQVSPGTWVVLMTAYGTAELRDIVNDLRIGGYIDKPFTAAQIREVVEKTMESAIKEKIFHDDRRSLMQSIHEHLQSLKSNTDATCVLLVSSDGDPIEIAGETNDMDIPSICTLVMGSFLASTELAKMVKSSSVAKSSYHEGSDCNIYAYDVNSDLLLVVVFDPTIKPGTVWFYTKQMANTLSSLVSNQSLPVEFANGPSETMDEEFEKIMVNKDGDKIKGRVVISFEEAIATGIVQPTISTDLPTRPEGQDSESASTNEVPNAPSGLLARG